MTKDLMRRLERLEKLERLGGPAWQTRLRAFARDLHLDEEAFLAAVQGHEQQLAEALGEGGQITWEGLQLFYDLWQPAGHGSPEPVTPQNPLDGDPR